MSIALFPLGHKTTIHVKKGTERENEGECTQQREVKARGGENIHLQRDRTPSAQSLDRTPSAQSLVWLWRKSVLWYYMWPSTRKGGKVAKNIFWDYAGSRIYWFVRVFAANLELIACCIAAVFIPTLAKATIAKTAIFMHTTRFSVYASVARCVLFGPAPWLCSHRAMSDV